jgi:hypothetical protein
MPHHCVVVTVLLSLCCCHCVVVTVLLPAVRWAATGACRHTRFPATWTCGPNAGLQSSHRSNMLPGESILDLVPQAHPSDRPDFRQTQPYRSIWPFARPGSLRLPGHARGSCPDFAAASPPPLHATYGHSGRRGEPAWAGAECLRAQSRYWSEAGLMSARACRSWINGANASAQRRYPSSFKCSKSGITSRGSVPSAVKNRFEKSW